jgi:hypothetical protein
MGTLTCLLRPRPLRVLKVCLGLSILLGSFPAVSAYATTGISSPVRVSTAGFGLWGG